MKQTDKLEKLAEKWLESPVAYNRDYGYGGDLKSLTRLLKRISRDAVRNNKLSLNQWYNDFYARNTRYPTIAEFMAHES